MEAHYISTFSLRDEQKISNMLLSSQAHTCGPNSKQMTLHSRAHCSVSTADSKGPEMSVPFKRKKASSLVLAALAREQIPREMRGNRGHLQGPSLLPLSFSILKCASILNATPPVLNSTGASHLSGRARGTGHSGARTLESDPWLPAHC